MATSFSRADVERIAELARLELTDAEVDLFTRQLTGILEYVRQINAVDTTGVPATSQVVQEPFEREDAPVEPLARASALANAPDAATEAGLFKVPRVIG
jgi:aspartyl-tRNA(Asn)/glutamyl-tRNA(Gln) amidotransferase subunit C